MNSRQAKANQGRKKKIRIHEMDLGNDIRYLGPLTSRHFKILGWICLAAAQAAVILRLGGRISQDFAGETAAWKSVLESAADLSLPFLLIATFAQLLSTQEGYRRPILVNAAAMAGFCAGFYLVFFRYIVGGIATFLTDPSEALPGVSRILSFAAPYGFISFNLFVDLLLCTLTMFFLNYNPRRIFTGKSRIIFRLFALLPIAYEVVCMVLKVRSARGLTQIPIWAWPLLTVKPPMTFVLFVTLVLFMKTRELRFRRHGRTHEEYQQFLKTRRNSWNFSVFLAIMMVLVSLADAAVMAGFSLYEVSDSLQSNVRAAVIDMLTENGQEVPENLDARIRKVMENYVAPTEAPKTADVPEATETPDPETALREGAAALENSKAAENGQAAPEVTPVPISVEAAAKNALDRFHQEGEVDSSMDFGIRIAEAVGFGGSFSLFFLAPLVLLFSYTRRPKNQLPDTLIPVAGIALIVMIYVEGIHQLLPLLPIEKVNLQELRELFTSYLSNLV